MVSTLYNGLLRYIPITSGEALSVSQFPKEQRSGEEDLIHVLAHGKGASGRKLPPSPSLSPSPPLLFYYAVSIVVLPALG